MVITKSAAGSAKMARNRKYQAILPIRGKIINVQKASMDKILKNEEIKDMINAFGCGVGEGYGNDFDINKLRYNKIIILSDADVDGSHISTLLLTFFYRFVPDLINEGHIYRAMPPLYKAKTSRSETYLYTDEELAALEFDVSYCLSHFSDTEEMLQKAIDFVRLRPNIAFCITTCISKERFMKRKAI